MTLIVPAPHESFDVDLEDGAKISVRRHGNWLLSIGRWARMDQP